ncbi:MAG: DNA ligase (NAD+) [Bradymonadia bacterium]|jgi:DNA ligase (NAD+)
MNEARILSFDADELEAEIGRHNDLYWIKDEREISDEIYDAMVERLKSLRPESALITQIGAGADEVAAAALSDVKVVHEHPMLSLDKCYSEDELLKWFGTFKGDALVTHKIDGVAMSIRYGSDGKLDLGVTRGNGRIGENVTANIRHVHDVPNQVDRPLEVRGEVYMPLSVFDSRYAKDFANPRNLCAGAIKQKDPAKTANYDLRFFAYDALGLEDAPTETAKRKILRGLGFVPAPGSTTSAENAQAAFDELSAHRSLLAGDQNANDFETDGIVYKVNDCSQHDAMGLTSHHPRYAIAYKYQGESGFSTLQGIEWNVSRSGSVNPIAHVAPVSLSGVTVTRVSLHNLSIIEKLGGAELVPGDNVGLALSKGARVLVTRRGGVIPHIEAVVESGDGSLHIPTECPSCGAATFRASDFLQAEHDIECVTQGVRTLEHFVKVYDIQGFGPKVIEQLWDHDMVRVPADLYVLTVEDLVALDRLGRRSAQNLVDAVNGKREVELAIFLAAWGIPDLGTSVSRYIQDAFVETPNIVSRTTASAAPQEELPLLAVAHSRRTLPDDATPMERGEFLLEEIRRAPATTFAEIAGIGPIVSEKIVDGLASRAGDLDALLQHVTVIADAPAPEVDPSGTVLASASFLFTGAMEQMSRKEAQEMVRGLGGTTPSGVSAGLDYLVLGDKDHPRYLGGWRSSKLQKAEKLIEGGSALQIISESEFLKRVGEESK